jgi:flavin-binding protein dodecin
MAVIKVIELVGTSTHGWQQAAENAVAEAAKTLDELVGVEVVGWTAKLNGDGELMEYRATVKVAFQVKSSL